MMRSARVKREEEVYRKREHGYNNTSSHSSDSEAGQLQAAIEGESGRLRVYLGEIGVELAGWLPAIAQAAV